MARMIPGFIDDRTPPGEKDVFNMLAKGPDDWVALHSLDLAPWNRGLRTEIDFVLIIPDSGIICIEVKSHLNITFDGNIWRPPEIKRSPFKQASDGRYTFYRHLRELAPQFRKIPVIHLCIFPNSPFNLDPNLSVAPWELMDIRTFRSFKTALAFCNDLKTRISSNIYADGNLTHISNPLSKSEVETIVAYCIPIQKISPNSREEIRRREQEIDRILRDQQKPILNLASFNHRIVVSGGAGTGKTLISMELARRRAESGERVALLCFNQLVGDWMKEKMALIKPELPNLIVGRCIQVMAEMTDLDIPKNPNNNYWDVTLPFELEQKLTDPNLREIALFDYLVLDEAQDIIARPNIWDCLVQLIDGGCEEGKYALIGDFEHQVLGERELLIQTLNQVKQQAQPSNWILSENCRNYSIVGETAVRLSGFEDRVYSGYMRQGGSVKNYDIQFYNTEDEQANLIAAALTDFNNQGYFSEEITILSFMAVEKSVVINQKLNKYNLRPKWQKGSFTCYSTVHAFKGLENKVIFLTDISANEAEFHRDLFYTGMTRATESVRVFCNNNFQETLLQWLTKGELKHV